MAPLKLLITGATGYIGGSILTTLQNSEHKSIKNLEISALVRGEAKVNLLKEHGVNPIPFRDLDDSEVITRAASEHDIVINTASGFHSGLARSLILGLGQRRNSTGNEVYYFHTTGTSNIGDRPITKTYYEPRIFSDRVDDIYSYLVAREKPDPYAQRTTDLTAIHTGQEQNVHTYLIMSPTIYGLGSGHFNRSSIQLPILIRSALQTGHVSVLGPGHGAWDAVHIDDLVLLYELLLAKILNGDQDVPSGTKGIFFSETGDFTWAQLAEGLAKAMKKQGLVETDEVKYLTLKEAADLWSDGNESHVELGFASNSRSRAELGRELGWQPRKTRADFAKSFDEEVMVIAKERK